MRSRRHVRSGDLRSDPRLFVTLAAGALLAACASGGGLQVESGPGGGGELPAGTELTAELENRLSIDDSEVGDSFHATVDEPVTRAGGTIVPEGALIHGRVTAVQRARSGDEPHVLKLAFDRLEIEGRSYPLDAELAEANPKTETGETLAKIGAGAAAGAIIGGIIGEDLEGAAIGAAVGAAAGTAVALGTRGHEAVLERGSEIRLVLRETIEVAPAR